MGWPRLLPELLPRMELRSTDGGNCWSTPEDPALSTRLGLR
jgi:hypothetical protein